MLNMSTRNVCFTLNNYSEEEEKDIQSLDCGYLVYGYEIGENGTPHLQGYIEFRGSKRWTTLKNLNKRIHWESRRGSSQQAINYCKKDGKYFEKGEPSRQGERRDLEELKNDIIEEKTTVDEITINTPNYYHLYGRTLNKIEDIALRKKYRNWMTTCDWLYGKTGAGKSHKAFENYNPDTHYVYPNDNGWWDGYSGQEIVIINEFRGQITYSELLDLIDKWPKTVKRRNREPVPFLAKHIIITSSLRPEEVYFNLAENDRLEQLLRRITVAEVVRG